jgi:hypothetical protein
MSGLVWDMEASARTEESTKLLVVVRGRGLVVRGRGLGLQALGTPVRRLQRRRQL